MTERRFIDVVEHGKATVPFDELPMDLAQSLRDEHGTRIQVGRSWSGNEWELTAGGWVGYIPLSPELGIALQPKVELRNLFRMLEYAYGLDQLKFPDGLIDSGSLRDYYESLAAVLARRVLDRARKGLYRSYLDETDHLHYVRGRIDVGHHVRAPWTVGLRCHYEEHTADIEDNQLLAWTLSRIARSGLCRGDRLRDVRRAYRAVCNATTPTAFLPADCIGRLYHRLNDDYEPLHALCRFFLEHSGPTHRLGDHTMLPFLADMPRVFELFVAEWLRRNLPVHLAIQAQHRVEIGQENELHFDIDLVIRDRDTGLPVFVLDTKYKRDTQPATKDFFQVFTYAESIGCRHAALIYPTPSSVGFSTTLSRVQVRSLAFSLDGELEAAGRSLLETLEAWVGRDEAVASLRQRPLAGNAGGTTWSSHRGEVAQRPMWRASRPRPGVG